MPTPFIIVRLTISHARTLEGNKAIGRDRFRKYAARRRDATRSTRCARTTGREAIINSATRRRQLYSFPCTRALHTLTHTREYIYIYIYGDRLHKSNTIVNYYEIKSYIVLTPLRVYLRTRFLSCPLNGCRSFFSVSSVPARRRTGRRRSPRGGWYP